MSARDDIMKDYVPVNERVAAFLAKHPEGSLQSELIELSDNRVVMKAYAYRSPTDERPGTGYSSLEIPGRTPYTRGSEIENAETSAWGRAIAALGFEVKRGIASAEEVRNKSGAEPKQTATEAGEFEPGALVGTIELSKDSPEFLPHVSAEGGTLTFKLRDKSGGIKVLVHGKLAYDLSMEKDDVVGQRATCFGAITDETFTPKGQTRKITYQVLTLSRIKVAGKEFPVPEADSLPLFNDAPLFDDALEEPPDDVPLTGETNAA